MYSFCFNDCFPKDSSNEEMTNALAFSLSEYNKVRESFPEQIDGIFTSQFSRGILLNNNNFTLYDSILSLDRETKRIAFRAFSKYPIEDLMPEVNEKDLVENTYEIQVNDSPFDAIYAKIAYDNGGVLFTVANHGDLRKDIIEIRGKGRLYPICNLYGYSPNTEFVKSDIREIENSKKGNFEKLLAVIGENRISGRFKKGFNKATNQVQNAIISAFQEAIDRKGPSKFHADGELIKDVLTVSEPRFNVAELRLFEPAAYRVYFSVINDTTFLALVEPKPPKKEQDNQIKTSKEIIVELLQTSLPIR